MWQNLSKSRKIYVGVGIILTIVVVLLLIANTVVSRIAESKIRSAISKSESGYKIDFRRAKINLFTMSVILKDVVITPDSQLMQQYKQHESTQKSLFKVDIPLLRLRHLNAISILDTKVIDIKEVVFEDVMITLFTGGGKQEKRKLTKAQVEKGININRIALPTIGGVDIGIVKFNNFTLFMVDPLKEDTLLNNSGADFTIDNLSLIKNPLDTNTFRLMLKDVRLDIEKETFDFYTKDYDMSFARLSFSVKSQLLHLEEFKVTPKKDMYAMAAAMKFRNDVYNVVIDQLDVHLGDVKDMVLTGGYYFPQINLDGLKLFVLRNRSLPFDESKRPLLPNQLLKNMTSGLTIDSVFIKNSQLVYEESNNDKIAFMKVSLDDLDITISNVTSVHDSMEIRAPMKIWMNAKLQKLIPFEVDFTFPLLSARDTFNYQGTMGGGSMSIFNPMLESAAGVKFSKGDLKSISFAVEANDTYAMGSMTMLYNSLEGTVLKNDGRQDNKLLSWIANQVLKADNPFPGEKPREVPIFFNRSMYKGFGNFAFKPLLSGILASTIPTFDKSNQKSIDEVNRTTKRDLRKREREARRDGR